MTENSMNIIVTGANRGLGKAFTEYFAKKGHNIWALCRTETEEFTDWCAMIAKENNVWIKTVKADLTDSADIEKAVKQIISEKKSVDILINNAGIGHMGLFQMTPQKQYKEIYDVNLFAPMQITQMLLRPMMRQGHGKIINVASTAATEIYEGNSIYGATKAALVAFTQSLAAEVYRYGITVNAIAPGLIDTDMSAVFEGNDPEEPIRHTALGRKIRPEEIADTVYKLIQMDVVNGEVLYINGGHK